MAAKGKNDRATIVIKKEEIVEGGHHGGAWKVAYADFVTAMMAFFLLMWLLNATTEEQRRGLADYFSPMNEMSRNASGTGQPFGGHTPYDHGSLASDRGAEPVMPNKSPPAPDEDLDGDQTGLAENFKAARQTGTKDNPAGGEGKKEQTHGNANKPIDQIGEQAPGGGVAAKQSLQPSRSEFLGAAGAGTMTKEQTAKEIAREKQEEAAKQAADRAEKQAFQQAAEQVRETVRNDPQLADLGKQLAIDITPEGLRIQLLDEDHLPMFASGSTVFNERARLLLQKVAPVLATLPEQLSITGHTDAAPYKGNDRTNWELSTERANATRRLLVEAGLPETRFNLVSGRADRDPLLPADPLAAANRRIAIVVQRAARAP